VFAAFEQSAILQVEQQKVTIADLKGKSSDQIKRIFDTMESHEDIVALMRQMSDAELFAYFT
jgi:hypothetical protein